MSILRLFRDALRGGGAMVLEMRKDCLTSRSPEAIRQEIDCIFLDPETFSQGNDFSSFSWRNRHKRDPVLLLSYFYLSVVVFHPATAHEQKLKYQVGTGTTLDLMKRLHSQAQTHKRPREYVPVGTNSKRYKTYTYVVKYE